MKFWTDKYVETRGVFSFEGDVYDDKYASGAEGEFRNLFLRLDRDAWKTREEAVASAQKRIKRAIASADAKKRRLTKLMWELEERK